MGAGYIAEGIHTCMNKSMNLDFIQFAADLVSQWVQSSSAPIHLVSKMTVTTTLPPPALCPETVFASMKMVHPKVYSKMAALMIISIKRSFQER
uniref:Uncharacterized protein n=1 Tax=Acrobeloides nanus TaxID=290746 RepID=A0A914DQL6_9BILA